MPDTLAVAVCHDCDFSEVVSLETTWPRAHKRAAENIAEQHWTYSEHVVRVWTARPTASERQNGEAVMRR